MSVRSFLTVILTNFKQPAIDNEMPDKMPYLIVGLGNPGREYRHNRHNVGFMLLDKLAERLEVKFSRLESKALVTKGSYLDDQLILAKPQTYMNNSGQAVGALQRFYKLPLGNLFVTYDDVDLSPGTIRIRPAGGSGGQKGMKSIIERLGSHEFPRMRLGVGRPPGRMDAADYVLRDFSKDEGVLISATLERGVEATLLYVNEGLEAAMNRYNETI